MYMTEEGNPRVYEVGQLVRTVHSIKFLSLKFM